MSQRPLQTILLVDDNEDDCELVREAWKEVQIGRELRCLNDGTELMAYLKREGVFASEGQAPRPSLILLDLHMPRMSGHEVLALVRQNPDMAVIPIIVLTTSKAPRDINRSAIGGVQGYIQKPNTFSGYLQLLENLQRYWQEILDQPYSRPPQGGGSGHPIYC